MKFDDLQIGKFFRCRIDGNLGIYKKISNEQTGNAIDMLFDELVAMIKRDIVEPIDVTITYTLPDGRELTQKSKKDQS